MNIASPIQKLFERYQCRTNDERRDALKEIVQEISLVALNRTHFFNYAAFYGGTALRIFYDLDRFSEDLDFSLIKPDASFDLSVYFRALRDELNSYGFDVEIEKKEKTAASAVQSAFIKGGTLINLIKIGPANPQLTGISKDELIRIKIEIDTDPPEGAAYEVKYRLVPAPYSVRLYDRPSLFAGKLHALLCRNWKSRVKGRDFFDYLWYLSKDIPLNSIHFDARMRQSKHWTGNQSITLGTLFQLLDERFSSLDFQQIKTDVLPFIKDTRSLELWSRDFFMSVTRDKLRIN